MRRKRRWLVAVSALLSLSVGLAIFQIAPRHSDKPLMTVYASNDCDECLRWMKHVQARGFRTELSLNEASEVKQRAKISASLAAPVLATVDEFVVYGFVPAREIHLLVERRLGESVTGVLVPGRPAGAPGVRAAIPEPYTVYAVLPRGMLRPIRTYNEPAHSAHMDSSF